VIFPKSHARARNVKAKGKSQKMTTAKGPGRMIGAALANERS
jgi:hypothetical protein